MKTIAVLAVLLASAVQSDGDTAPELTQSGVAHLRAGRVERAVEQLDRAAEMDPESSPHLWQRGVALYLAGEYRKGREQFELHRTVNPRDVENATWHFLCVAATEGVDKAREEMLAAPDDRRVPMEQLYALYEGTGDRQSVEAAVNQLAEGSSGRRTARFYADLYLGLLAHAEGKPDEAKRYLKRAAAVAEKNVMTDVARVCFQRLVPQKTAE